MKSDVIRFLAENKIVDAGFQPEPREKFNSP
jgi:hypothetical protein